MGLFGRKAYSRRDSLTAANEAQKKGKQKKAIAEYKKILENDGPDPMIHHKLAMALAESKKTTEARESFLIAARAYDDRGFDDKALAVYVTAAHYLPTDIEMWEAISEAQLKKERTADAIKALLDARKHFQKKKQRDHLIRLLERACRIEPWQFEATFDLAGVLWKMGERERAREMMEGLAKRNTGRHLRLARGRQFRWSPTPLTAWRWLRALLFIMILGCTKSPVAVQSIGAVCMRAKEIAGKNDSARVQIANELLEKRDPIVLAARCDATRSVDAAIQDMYLVILDAQLVTTDRWTPMSEAIRKISAPTDACTAIENGLPDAHQRMLGWIEDTRSKHDAAHQACRSLAK